MMSGNNNNKSSSGSSMTSSLSTGSLTGLLKSALAPVRPRGSKSRKTLMNKISSFESTSTTNTTASEPAAVAAAAEEAVHFEYSIDTTVPPAGSHRLPGSRRAQQDAMQNLMVRMELSDAQKKKDVDDDGDDDASIGSADPVDNLCHDEDDEGNTAAPVPPGMAPPGSHGLPGSRRAQQDAMENFMVRMEQKQQQQQEEALSKEEEDDDDDDDDEQSVGSGHRYPGARKAQQQAFQNFLSSASEDDDSDSDSDSDDEDSQSVSTPKSKSDKECKKSRKLTKKFFGEISIPKAKLFPLAA